MGVNGGSAAYQKEWSKKALSSSKHKGLHGFSVPRQQVMSKIMAGRHQPAANKQKRWKSVRHTTKKKVLFTVAVVTYNQRHQLQECLESIANQDYAPIELIIVDDYSCDFVYDEVHELAARICGDRIHSIIIKQHDSHAGAAQAYQTALEAASGEYILFLGGDDRLFCDDAISKVWNYLWRRKPAFLQCRAVLQQYAKCTLQPDDACVAKLKTGVKNDIVIDASTHVNEKYLCLQALVMRRESLIRIGGFNEKYEHAFDWALLFQLLYSCHAIAVLNETITLKLGSGAYHNDYVGCVYLKEAYAHETRDVLIQYALPAAHAMNDLAVLGLTEKTIRSIDERITGIYHWYHYSAKERIKWHQKHKNEIIAARKNSLTCGNGLFPLRKLLLLLTYVIILNISLIELDWGRIVVLDTNGARIAAWIAMILLLSLVLLHDNRRIGIKTHISTVVVCIVGMIALICLQPQCITLQILASGMLVALAVLSGVDVVYRIWNKFRNHFH